MEVIIKPAPVPAKILIDEMMQPYFAELEQFAEIGTNEDGRDEYAFLDNYWSEPESRCPFLIEVDGAVAGFVLVSMHSRLGDAHTRSISEFYISPTYRHSGAGTQAARQTILMFAGKWEVGVLEQNLPARAFWKHVFEIDAVTDLTVHSGIWKGPVYSFRVTRPTAKG